MRASGAARQTIGATLCHPGTGRAVAPRPPAAAAAAGRRRSADHALRPSAPRRGAPAAAARRDDAAFDDGGLFPEGYADEPQHVEPPAQPEAQQAQRLRHEYARGHCYGCGVRLQASDPEVAGFVEPERYEVKLRHKQLGQLLCVRCQELSNGAMIPAVADFAQRAQPAAGAAAGQAQQQAQQAQQQEAAAARRHTGFTDKALLTPEELRQKLKVVQQQRALVVLLVDLLDASGSILGKVRELVGNNPIMLIGTKVDLLPAGSNPAEIAEWLRAFAAFKRISAVSVHLVSSKSGAGVPAAVAAIRRERRGRDVYVMGAANVGKSAFIRALVRDMASMGSRQFDPLALSRGRYLPVESAMPGTTLEVIPMEVFASGGCLYDTPGLHLHHRVPHLLTPAENKQLHPRRKLRAYVPPSPSELLEATTADCELPASGSVSGVSGGDGGGAAGPRCNVATYWWGGLVKLQVLACPPDTELVFYGPQALLVEASVEPADSPASAAGGSADGGDPLSSTDSDSEAAPVAGAAAAAAEEAQGFGALSVMRRGGLRPAKELRLKCGGEAGRSAIADVAVSGVPGWIAVHASGSNKARVILRVWTPPGVEVFSRPPMPVPSPLAPPQPQLAGRAVAAAAPAAGGAAQQQRKDGAAVEDWW